MPEVVVLGVFAADLAFRADRLPRVGETILGRGFGLGPGGKGSNQAVAAARAGGRVSMLTRIGGDAFGALALRTWAEAGVGTEAVERAGDEATGAAFIFVDDATGDNAIVVSPGAAGRIDGPFADRHAARIGAAAVFVTQLEQPMEAAMRALGIAADGGALTVLNPAPAAALPEGMLALCDYVTPNETEAAEITGEAVDDLDGARRAGDRLLAAGVRRAAILTLGARGALFHAEGRSEVVPAFPAEPVVDTTGAGDAFNGGFAAALAEGRDPLEAVRFGCAVASLSVRAAGAAAAMPPREAVERLVAGVH